MKTKNLAITLLSTTLLFGACEKKKDDNGGSGSTSLLTNKKWKMVSSKSDMSIGGNTQTVDLFALFQACQQDNLFIFESNNTNTIDEGPTKCNASDPQTRTDGTWELSNNNTKLKISGSTTVEGLSEITADVLELTNTSLKVKYATNINNIPMTTTTDYVVVP